MSRTRNLKPGFFTNEDLAACSPLARILFAGLWLLADREGRLEDRPLRIKAELLPYDPCDADVLLDELARRRFIVRYSAESRRYLAVSQFAKHQRPHPKEPKSVIPPPPSSRVITRQEMYDPTEPPGPSPSPRAANSARAADSCEAASDPVSRAVTTCKPEGGYGKAVERNGEPSKETEGCAYIPLILHSSNPLISVSDETDKPSSSPPSAPKRSASTALPNADPALLEFPCDGISPAWPLRQSHVDEWSPLFPSLDILAECRKALAWILATPTRRKTAAGMKRFLVGWFGRAQDRSRAAPGAAAKTPNGRGTAADIKERSRRFSCPSTNGSTNGRPITPTSSESPTTKG